MHRAPCRTRSRCTILWQGSVWQRASSQNCKSGGYIPTPENRKNTHAKSWKERWKPLHFFRLDLTHGDQFQFVFYQILLSNFTQRTKNVRLPPGNLSEFLKSLRPRTVHLPAPRSELALQRFLLPWHAHLLRGSWRYFPVGI